MAKDKEIDWSIRQKPISDAESYDFLTTELTRLEKLENLSRNKIHTKKDVPQTSILVQQEIENIQKIQNDIIRILMKDKSVWVQNMELIFDQCFAVK